MQYHKISPFALLLITLFLMSCGEPPIEWQEAQTSAAETKSITLPDNSIAHLNENSYLKYPVEFTQSNRKVELKGIAFFDVQNDKKTFVVATEKERITVSAASKFNVNTHENVTSTSVNVAAGGVTLQPSGGGGEVELSKGVKGIFDREKKALSRIRKSTPSDMYWHTKRLEFNDTYMARVIDDLTRTFGAEITMTNPGLGKCPFTYTADNATLKEVVDAIGKSVNANVFEESEVIYSLIGGSCE
ncbi:MAG: transmembrane sensor [Paraglaciecola sp.]|jgi:transmembrane sensor